MNISLSFASLLLAGTIATWSISHAGGGNNQNEESKPGSLRLSAGELRNAYNHPDKVLEPPDGRRFSAKFTMTPPNWQPPSMFRSLEVDDNSIMNIRERSLHDSNDFDFKFTFTKTTSIDLGLLSPKQEDGEDGMMGIGGSFCGCGDGCGGCDECNYYPEPYVMTTPLLLGTLKLIQEADSAELKASTPSSSQSPSQNDGELHDDLNELTLGQIREAVKQGIISESDAFEMKVEEPYTKVMAGLQSNK